MSLFENRRSRFKESGKKVPQAYRVYGEDTFLPCDAEDARPFASPFENRRGKYKEFSKSEAEAYLLYVEHSLLRNDAVDALPLTNALTNRWSRCLVSKCTSVYICWRRVFAVQKHRCCMEPPPSMAVLIRLLKIAVPDTRRRVNNTRRRTCRTSRTVVYSATP